MTGQYVLICHGVLHPKPIKNSKYEVELILKLFFANQKNCNFNMVEGERDQDGTICPKMPWCASFQPDKKLEQISKYLVELILKIFFCKLKK